MKFEFSWQIFQRYSNIKFHKNPFIGSRVVPYGRMDGQAHMKKLTVAFRNFSKAPNNETPCSKYV
jgi:hypothetical protein